MDAFDVTRDLWPAGRVHCLTRQREVDEGARECDVHTAYSFDAFAFGTTATPYDAYRYATGQAIKHPAGFDVQLRQPLDFYAVTDHAMFLGAVRAAADTSTEFSKLEYVKDLHNLNAESNLNTQSVPQRIQAFRGFLPGTLFGISDGGIWLIRTVI